MLRKRKQQQEENNTRRSAQKIVHWMKTNLCKYFKQKEDKKRNDDEQKSVRKGTVKFTVQVHRINIFKPYAGFAAVVLLHIDAVERNEPLCAKTFVGHLATIRQPREISKTR